MLFLHIILRIIYRIPIVGVYLTAACIISLSGLFTNFLAVTIIMFLKNIMPAVFTILKYKRQLIGVILSLLIYVTRFIYKITLVLNHLSYIIVSFILLIIKTIVFTIYFTILNTLLYLTKYILLIIVLILKIIIKINQAILRYITKIYNVIQHNNYIEIHNLLCNMCPSILNYILHKLLKIEIVLISGAKSIMQLLSKINMFPYILKALQYLSLLCLVVLIFLPFLILKLLYKTCIIYILRVNNYNISLLKFILYIIRVICIDIIIDIVIFMYITIKRLVLYCISNYVTTIYALFVFSLITTGSIYYYKFLTPTLLNSINNNLALNKYASSVNKVFTILKHKQYILNNYSYTLNYKVNQNSTLNSILTSSLSSTEYQAVSKVLAPYKKERFSKVSIIVNKQHGFKSITLPIKNKIITISNDYKNNNVTLATHDVRSINYIYNKRISIKNNFFIDSANNNVPSNIAHEVADILRNHLDFQRDMHKGDHIGMIYQCSYTEYNTLLYCDNLQYITFKSNNKILKFYLYKGHFYNSIGESAKSAILRTPVPGYRLSSTFGARIHPVLGFTRMHKGVDFAVPPNTPIPAAGDGIIKRIVRSSGYGNWVEIEHQNHISTRYAHMSRFGKFKVGQKVKQGQIIGYSGSTGLSTGPHLHYETLINHVQKNPLEVPVQPIHILNPDEKLELLKVIEDTNTLLSHIPSNFSTPETRTTHTNLALNMQRNSK